MSTQLLRSQCWLMEVNVCATTSRRFPRPTPAHLDLSRPGTRCSGDALGRLGMHGLALVADTCRRCSRRWCVSEDHLRRLSEEGSKTTKTSLPSHSHMAPPLSWCRPVIPLNPPHAWEAQGCVGNRIDIAACGTYTPKGPHPVKEKGLVYATCIRIPH